MASASAALADADTGAVAPPGDFGETLFRDARDVIETKCDEVFDAYCERVQEACRAAAKEGNMRTEMPPIALSELESAIFLEKLRDRYNKCGVHAEAAPYTRVMREHGADDPAAGIAFVFAWSCTNQSEGGRLQPLNPEGLAALVKPARGEVLPFHRGYEPNHTNSTYLASGEPLKRFGP